MFAARMSPDRVSLFAVPSSDPMSLPVPRIDTLSVYLLACIAVLLLVIKLTQHFKQPLLHPLILARQSEASAVRAPRESAIYRNVNAPLGLDLAMRPSRNVPDVSALLAEGIAPGVANHVRRVLTTSLSNEELRQMSAEFVAGVRARLHAYAVSIIVCGTLRSTEELAALLAGAVADGVTVYAAPGPVDTALPPGADPSNTAVVCIDVIPPTFARAAALLVVSAGAGRGDRIVEWADVLGAAAEAKPRTPSTAAGRSTAELDAIGAATFAYFHDAESDAWLRATHTSMTSGVTAWLSQFAADAVPSIADVALTDVCEENAVPLSTFAALLLALLYTGAGIVSEPPQRLARILPALRPTLLYLSDFGAQCIEQRLWLPSIGMMMYPAMCRFSMDSLRHGIFPRDKLLDRWVNASVRAQFGLDHVRAVVISGNGCAAEQTLLDQLRMHLGVPVMHAYVPQKLSGAAVTAPVSTSNMYDLQAFAPQLVDDDSARCLPAHVGPPAVSLEIKLVDGTPAVTQHAAAIQRLRAPINGASDDPVGEIYVRGYSLTRGAAHEERGGAQRDSGTHMSEWLATGDVGTMRTNGTLVLVAPAGSAAGMMPNTVSAVDAAERLSERLRGRTRQAAAPAVRPGKLALAAVTMALGAAATAPHHGGAPLVRRGAPIKANHTMEQLALAGLMSSQRASWEQGVAQSARLELTYPRWSVFSKTHKQWPAKGSIAPDDMPEAVLQMAYHSASAQDASGRLAMHVTGDEKAGQGAAQDSASCGEGVLLGAWIKEGFTKNKPDRRAYFGGAAWRQLHYLQTNVTRHSNGALSQRASKGDVELWSDTAYMGPPFFALYGSLTHDQNLLASAHKQLGALHSALRLPTGSGAGLWGHIVSLPHGSPRWIDARAWLTGNGWAAAGMLRVAATIDKSPFAANMSSQRNELIQWADDILHAAYPFADESSGLLYNVVNDTSTFLDASGSALLAYSVFRLGGLDPKRRDFVHNAERAYVTLSRALDEFGAFTNGVQTVNELSSHDPAPTSTESLAFLVLLSAARRDFYSGNVTGSNGTAAQHEPNNGAASTAPVWVSVVAAIVVALALTVMD